MALKSKAMVKLLKQHGFIKKSQNSSSHLKMWNPNTNKTIIVPVHGKELSEGIEPKILKKAGIKKGDN